MHSQLHHLIIAFNDLQMQLGRLQLPVKLLAAVQQHLQVTDQVTDQATEEVEVGEVSAIAVTKGEAITRLTSGLHSLSLLRKKASHLCRQTVVVAGISLLLLGAARAAACQRCLHSGGGLRDPLHGMRMSDM